MNKWEYMRIQCKSDAIKSVDETVDQLGREGWELVSVVFTTAYSYVVQRPFRLFS